MGLSLRDMKPAYVFDLDGTLLDSAPDLNFALNVLMARENRRDIALGEMPLLIGKGVNKLIERAFERTGDAVDTDRLAGLHRDFLEIYLPHQTDRSRLYPGVVETLETLKAEGVRLAILTNKPQESANDLVVQFGLDRFFPIVYGGDRLDWLKPDARLFEAVLNELGGEGPAVMIGDSVTDVETGRNAGVPTILVGYGYSAEPPETLGADMLVTRFADVPAAAAILLEDSSG